MDSHKTEELTPPSSGDSLESQTRSPVEGAEDSLSRSILSASPHVDNGRGEGVVCPGGHPMAYVLRESVYDSDSVMCNRCRENDLEKIGFFWHCSECSFDLCKRCAEGPIEAAFGGKFMDWEAPSSFSDASGSFWAQNEPLLRESNDLSPANTKPQEEVETLERGETKAQPFEEQNWDVNSNAEPGFNEIATEIASEKEDRGPEVALEISAPPENNAPFRQTNSPEDSEPSTLTLLLRAKTKAVPSGEDDGQDRVEQSEAVLAKVREHLGLPADSVRLRIARQGVLALDIALEKGSESTRGPQKTSREVCDALIELFGGSQKALPDLVGIQSSFSGEASKEGFLGKPGEKPSFDAGKVGIFKSEDAPGCFGLSRKNGRQEGVLCTYGHTFRPEPFRKQPAREFVRCHICGAENMELHAGGYLFDPLCWTAICLKCSHVLPTESGLLDCPERLSLQERNSAQVESRAEANTTRKSPSVGEGGMASSNSDRQSEPIHLIFDFEASSPGVDFETRLRTELAGSLAVNERLVSVLEVLPEKGLVCAHICVPPLTIGSEETRESPLSVLETFLESDPGREQSFPLLSRLVGVGPHVSKEHEENKAREISPGASCAGCLPGSHKSFFRLFRKRPRIQGSGPKSEGVENSIWSGKSVAQTPKLSSTIFSTFGSLEDGRSDPNESVEAIFVSRRPSASRESEQKYSFSLRDLDLSSDSQMLPLDRKESPEEVSLEQKPCADGPSEEKEEADGTKKPRGSEDFSDSKRRDSGGSVSDPAPEIGRFGCLPPMLRKRGRPAERKLLSLKECAKRQKSVPSSRPKEFRDGTVISNARFSSFCLTDAWESESEEKKSVEEDKCKEALQATEEPAAGGNAPKDPDFPDGGCSKHEANACENCKKCSASLLQFLGRRLERARPIRDSNHNENGQMGKHGAVSRLFRRLYKFGKKRPVKSISGWAQKCPKGHLLRRRGSKGPEPDAVRCDVCGMQSGAQSGSSYRHCEECDFDVCGDCFRLGEQSPEKFGDVWEASLEASRDNQSGFSPLRRKDSDPLRKENASCLGGVFGGGERVPKIFRLFSKRRQRAKKQSPERQSTPDVAEKSLLTQEGARRVARATESASAAAESVPSVRSFVVSFDEEVPTSLLAEFGDFSVEMEGASFLTEVTACAASGEKDAPSGEKDAPSGEKGAPSGEKGAPSGEKDAPSGEKALSGQSSRRLLLSKTERLIEESEGRRSGQSTDEGEPSKQLLCPSGHGMSRVSCSKAERNARCDRCLEKLSSGRGRYFSCPVCLLEVCPSCAAGSAPLNVQRRRGRGRALCVPFGGRARRTKQPRAVPRRSGAMLCTPARGGLRCPRRHTLRPLRLTRNNGWVCDMRAGRRGCASGIQKAFESNGVERFRCDRCDFDVCDRCFHREAIEGFSAVSLGQEEFAGEASGPRGRIGGPCDKRTRRKAPAPREDLSVALKIMQRIVDSYVGSEQKQ